MQYLATAFSQTNTGKALPPPPALPNPNPDLTAVPDLVYGNPYEFRVRLVDLTGGGPLPGDAAIHPGPAPRALTDFLRYLPPKALEIVSSPASPATRVDRRQHAQSRRST